MKRWIKELSDYIDDPIGELHTAGVLVVTMIWIACLVAMAT